MRKNPKKKDGLGQRIEAIRRRNHWTLADVSKMTGIAVSTLSKVENDQTSLTYDNILKLSGGLGLDVSDLFSGERERPTGGRRAITRKADGKELETEKYLYHYHATDLRETRMIPMIVEVKARSIEEFGEMVQHSGEEFIFVLQGRIEVHTELYEPVMLSEGESIYLDATMGHAYVCAGEDTARLLGVCTSPTTRFRERVAAGMGRSGLASRDEVGK